MVVRCFGWEQCCIALDGALAVGDGGGCRRMVRWRWVTVVGFVVVSGDSSIRGRRGGHGGSAPC